MKLRDKLQEILPSLLPTHPSDAIKGSELIGRVRAILGDAYSDQSLRSQFSFLVLDAQSCLARIENGQGYYLRHPHFTPSLHSMFESPRVEETEDPYRKALALALRLYDGAAMSSFVYPVEEESSWAHPDMVSIQWPAAEEVEGALVFSDSPSDLSLESVRFRSVAMAVAESPEDLRRAFFRALACGDWAEEVELILFSQHDLPSEELFSLSARYGVGVRLLGVDEDLLEQLPGADELFRMTLSEARDLLAQLSLRHVASPRLMPRRLPPASERPDVAALVGWVQNCLAKGRVEAYERRVALD